MAPITHIFIAVGIILMIGGAHDLPSPKKLHKRLQQVTEYLMNIYRVLVLPLIAFLVALPVQAAPRIPRAKVLFVLIDATGFPVCDPGMASLVIGRAIHQMAPAVRVSATLMVIGHPFPELQTYQNRNALAQALLRFAKRDMRFSGKRIHFMTPALVGPNGEWYSYGLGSSSCNKRAVSVGSCIQYNDLGQNREIASAFTTAHETLHGMGARHTLGGLSIMDPDPLPLSVEYSYLPVKKRTIREVRQCLTK